MKNTLFSKSKATSFKKKHTFLCCLQQLKSKSPWWISTATTLATAASFMQVSSSSSFYPACTSLWSVPNVFFLPFPAAHSSAAEEALLILRLLTTVIINTPPILAGHTAEPQKLWGCRRGCCHGNCLCRFGQEAMQLTSLQENKDCWRLTHSKHERVNTNSCLLLSYEIRCSFTCTFFIKQEPEMLQVFKFLFAFANTNSKPKLWPLCQSNVPALESRKELNHVWTYKREIWEVWSSGKGEANAK